MLLAADRSEAYLRIRVVGRPLGLASECADGSESDIAEENETMEMDVKREEGAFTSAFVDATGVVCRQSLSRLLCWNADQARRFTPADRFRIRTSLLIQIFWIPTGTEEMEVDGRM